MFAFYKPHFNAVVQSTSGLVYWLWGGREVWQIQSPATFDSNNKWTFTHRIQREKKKTWLNCTSLNVYCMWKYEQVQPLKQPPRKPPWHQPISAACHRRIWAFCLKHNVLQANTFYSPVKPLFTTQSHWTLTTSLRAS